MNGNEFIKLIEELKNVDSDFKGDYYIELYYNGNDIGCIYGESDYLDDIEVNDRQGYFLVYTDTFGVFVDNAELKSI